MANVNKSNTLYTVQKPGRSFQKHNYQQQQQLQQQQLQQQQLLQQ